jgi:hypothetical protein
MKTTLTQVLTIGLPILVLTFGFLFTFFRKEYKVDVNKNLKW